MSIGVLLLAATLTAYLVGMAWRQYPFATAIGFGLFVLGGGFALWHPKNAVGYSVTLGGVLGVFLGTAIVLIGVMRAS